MGRAIIFDGTNDYLTNTSIGTAVPSAQSGWRFMMRFRGIVTTGGGAQHYIFRDNNAEVLTVRQDDGGAFGVFVIFVGPAANSTGSVTIPATDGILLVRANPAGTEVSAEVWDLDGGNRAAAQNLSASGSATNFQNQNIAVGAFQGGSNFFAGKVDIMGFLTGAGTYNAAAPDPLTATYNIMGWTFDADDGADSSGNGVTLTLNGSPVFEDTPGVGPPPPAWGVPKLGTLVEDATGNFDLIEPAGVAQGDLMIACIAYRGNAAITLPAGWATVATAQNSGDTDATNGIASGVMAYIVRGSSAPALTCTRTAGDVVLARIISYSGGSRFPYDTGSSNTLGSASTTATTGTITTAEAKELLVAMTAAGDTYLASAFDAATDPATASGATDTTTAPTAGTWIERQDSSTGTGADTGLAIADAIKATAGATGTIQATIAGSSQHVMIVGAFKIAPAPGRIYMVRQAVNRSNTF